MEMKLITDIQIDLYGETKYYLVSAKQGDKNTRYIRVQLMNNGVEYVIPTDMITVANLKKPDGKYCYNECEVKDNRIIVQLTNQMLAVSGTAYCDVEIKDINGNLILSSEAFTVEIEPSMRNEDAILSSNEMGVLDAAMKRYHEAEMAREAAEAERGKKEGERRESEEERESSEEARKQKETERQIAENLRHAAEETREQNESIRIQNEDARIKNETGRNSAETVRQEKLQEMIKATKAAKDATEAIADHVESVGKECSFQANSPGWYRIAKFLRPSNASPGAYMYCQDISCFISIRRLYNSITPEYHMLNLACALDYTKNRFVVISRVGNVAFDQIRVIYKEQPENAYYLDVKYDTNIANRVYFQITNNYPAPSAMVDNFSSWLMINPIRVASDDYDHTIADANWFGKPDFYVDNYALPLTGGTVTGFTEFTQNVEVDNSVYIQKYLNIRPWEGYESDTASYNSGTKLWYDAKTRTIKNDSGGAVNIGLNALWLAGNPIEANEDLNNYRTGLKGFGFYYCPANAIVETLKNCPTSNAFGMILLPNSGSTQILVEYPRGIPPQIWIRNYYSGDFGSWHRIPVLDASNYLLLPSYMRYNGPSPEALWGTVDASNFLYVSPDGYVRKGSGSYIRDRVLKMIGATTSAAGAGGTVPAPSAGDIGRTLLANGTWGYGRADNADRLNGIYTGSGGAHGPNWLGKGYIRVWMANSMPSASKWPDGTTGYCDVLGMNSYTGADVPYATALCLKRGNAPRAYIFTGSDTSGTWNWGHYLLQNSDMSATAVANTLVLRDASNYVHLDYIESNTSRNENPVISQFIVTNGSDHYYRKASLEHVKASVGLTSLFGGDYSKNITTANATVNGSLRVNSGTELYGSSPFVDFHHGNSSADYTGRIIADRNNGITLRGVIYFNDHLYVTTNELKTLSANGIHISAYDNNYNVYMHGKAVYAMNHASSSYIPIYASVFSVSSSKRYKENIQNITEEEALKLLKLRPTSFDYIKGDKNRRGFIAEEVEPLFPHACVYGPDTPENGKEPDLDAEDKLQGLDYASFVPDIVKLIQMQQRQIDSLAEVIEEQKKEISGLKEQMESIKLSQGKN